MTAPATARLHVAGLACALSAALTACTGGNGSAEPTTPTAPATPTTPPSASTPATATPTVATFEVARVMADVRRLAEGGPREATSRAFRAAADVVERRFTELGYEVARQRLRVPAGESWGLPVGAGTTANVVARAPGIGPTAEHVVVGAHLDTVPQSPGAEDNASGVAVLLELARVAAANGTRVPVVFVAFGAEEPRGPGDDEHHFGSRAYVRGSAGAQRDALLGMVSLDRVGAPGPVPVCTGGRSPLRVRDELLGAADRVGVRAEPCENRTSDHWPFEKAGETVARVGGNPSPGYHSPRDVPRQVSRQQLGEVGAVTWEWLRPG